MSVSQVWISTMVAGVFLAVGAPSFGQKQSEESREKTIELSQVPQAAVEAAQKALGTAPTEATMISGTSPQEYELEAKNKSGKEIGVHVSADGKVLKKPHNEATEHEEHEKH